MTIEDVAKITKIQARILEKLESGSFDGLPAEVFVRGFVRSFAKCVGLSETEALDKYSQAQAAPSTSGPIAVAKALAETIAPAVRKDEPVDEKQCAPMEAATARTSTIAPTSARIEPQVAVAVEAPTEVPTEAPAPVVHAAMVDAVTCAPSAPSAASESPKKKRSRKRNRGRNKRKQLEVAQASEITTADAITADAITFDTAPVAKIDGESPDATSIEAKTDTLTTSVAVDVVEDGAVGSPSLAEGSQRITQPAIAAIETELAETDSTAGTWQPTMPPISSAPSVPWRRPSLPASTAYVVPSLIIDDADPESADRERDDRIAKEPTRLSFLPPILLDREDRSSRQGGLTLAVIILLIAATLTLSYLMRRPSPSGDGVTMLDAPSMMA